LGDDLDIRISVEDHLDPAAHEFLVLQQDHLDAHVTTSFAAKGKIARTRYPPSSVRPVRSGPPAKVTRSRMPSNPYPYPGPAASARSCSGWFCTVTLSSVSPASTATSTAACGACFAALVSASCTTR